MMTAGQGITLAVLCVSLMALLFWLLTRSLKGEETNWRLLCEGTVFASQLCQVPFVPAQEYGNGWPTPPDVMTVLTLKDGQGVAVVGDHLTACEPGSKVAIWMNGLGTFRITKGEQPQ